MTLRSYRTFQALLLAALGLFLLDKVWSGAVLLYINRRFVLLVMLAGLLCVALAQVVLRARPAVGEEDGSDLPADIVDHEHAHPRPSGANLLWLLIPVVLGFLIPARPLGANALATRGVNTSAPLTVAAGQTANTLALPAADRTVLDWIRVFRSTGDLRTLAGQAVNVTGFVFHDPALPDRRFLVGRFTITCCVADAAALGMTVDWAGAGELRENSWVRVRGEIALDEDTREPYIRATHVETIPEPDNPYLYP